MNPHMTWEEISEYLISGAPANGRHAAECGSCRSELARFETALAEFRGSVRNWSSRLSAIHAPLGSEVISTTIPSAEVHLDQLLARTQGMYRGNELKAGLSSILINATVIALLIVVGTVKPVQRKLAEFVPLIAPDLRPLPPQEQVSKGGGGGAEQTDVAQGKLPRSAPRQFVPPSLPVEQPALPLNPSIVAPDLPNITAQDFGDPLGRLGIPSAGNGLGRGIGAGVGPGVGPGSGGGFGGGVYRIGGGITAPLKIFGPEPEYSEEARKAKWQGAVLLSLIIDANGVPQDIKVMRTLGLGLDEKAIEAVRKWRFKPGLKDGKPVPVFASIEINFRLL